MTKESIYPTDKDTIAAYAFANCIMILRNAISMPDSYIEKAYGSDEGMLAVAEKYYDFGIKVLNTMPPLKIKDITITTTSPIREKDDDE